jgi:hypothetical protein
VIPWPAKFFFVYAPYKGAGVLYGSAILPSWTHRRVTVFLCTSHDRINGQKQA